MHVFAVNRQEGLEFFSACIFVPSPLCGPAINMFFDGALYAATYVCIPYLLWAVTFSNVHFHRVWSVSLCSFIVELQALQKPSRFTDGPLILLLFLNGLFCLALSPAQVLLHCGRKVSKHMGDLEIVNKEDPNSPFIADIVIVHGLASDPDTTWETQGKLSPESDQAQSERPKKLNESESGQGQERQSSQAGATDPITRNETWVRDWLPCEGLDSRIMVFQHESVWGANALSKSLENHGDDLVQALELKRETDDERNRPLIFIGHSFGGLIIKQALLSENSLKKGFCADMRSASRGFIFLATPHKGSEFTAMGKILTLLGYLVGSSNNLLEIIETGSSVNESLHRRFLEVIKNGCTKENVLCIFETVREYFLGLALTHVVRVDSAIIEDTRHFGSQRNHRGVQRYTSKKEDGEYKKVVFFLREIVNKHRLELAEKETKVEGKHSESEKACLQSLSFSEMYSRAEQLQPESGTCKWLLKKPEYLAWHSRKDQLLWIRGQPGSGKSTLVKYAFDNFDQPLQTKQEVLASFFFHARGSDMQKTTTGLLRSLLHQIAFQVPDVLSKITELHGRDPQEWREPQLRNIFIDDVKPASLNTPIRIYVDALDECESSDQAKMPDQAKNYNEAKKLLKFLRELTDSESNISVLISCRYFPYFNDSEDPKIIVEDGTETDISHYLDINFARELRNKNRNNLEAIQSKIAKKASRSFQWVCLVTPIIVELIQGGATPKEIHNEINKLPSGLECLYCVLLDRIESEDKPKTLQLMQWIYFSARPLTMSELPLGIAFDDFAYESVKDCMQDDSFIPNAEAMADRVNRLSRGLAEVRDYEGRTIAQFIHESVSDYLRKNGFQQLESRVSPGPVQLESEKCEKCELIHPVSNLQRSRAEGTESPDRNLVTIRGHFRISRSCLRYLNSQEILGLGSSTVARNKILDVYAVKYWGHHVQAIEDARTTVGGNHEISTLAGLVSPSVVKRLEQFQRHAELASGIYLSVARQNHILAIRILLKNKVSTLIRTSSIYSASPLHNAALFGDAESTQLLLEAKADVDLKDSDGFTPLSLAATKGHEAVVGQLLATGRVDVNSKDKYDRTPLLCAAINGHEAVVKQLLATGQIDVDSKDRSGQTPLFKACVNEHKAVVGQLLATGQVDVNSKDIFGDTALLRAATEGHEAVVGQLLATGQVGVNSKDKFGYTPLSWAASKGHEAVVKQLLATGHVDVNSEDRLGNTLLSRAAQKGHNAVVKLLQSASSS